MQAAVVSPSPRLPGFSLVENSGFTEIGYVMLYDNPLDCDDETTLNHIATLEARGISVWGGCALPDVESSPP